MAVLTFGDIRTQCRRITGIRESETEACEALDAAINTAHTKVVKAAIAEGFPYMLKTGVALSVASTDNYVVLPDGSTVTDVNSVVAPRCVTVVAVRLGSMYSRLSHYAKDAWEAEFGRLENTHRSIPQFYDPYGVDSTGRMILWLMPLPGAADTIYVDYIGGLSYLTTANQALLVPQDDRELVAQEAIACVSARDTIDATIIQKAQQDAAWLWRCFYATAQQHKPRFTAPRQVFGHVR